MTDLNDIELDEEGYLVNLDDWTPAIAASIADLEQITLTEEHWEVIDLLRDFYHEYQLSPAMRPFVKAVKLKLGANKGNSIHLMKLFPESPAKRAAKIAGLPKPDNCL